MTYGGYCCLYKLGKFCGGVGCSEYPGAKVYFSQCLEEWFDQLIVGQLKCVALGDAVQRFFWVFGVHFQGGGQFVNIYPFGKWDFEEVGEVLLWGSLSCIPGDRFFGVDARGPV